jgi:signal transduction histidine kinase
MPDQKTTSVISSPRPVNLMKASGFALLAVLANLVNAFFYFTEGLWPEVWMELTGIGILLICVLLNRFRLFTISKLLSLLIVNFQVAYLSTIQGVSGGAYLYLFPYILSLLFLLRLNKRRYEAFFPLALTILTLGYVLLFTPYRAAMTDLVAAKLNRHYSLNILLTFLLTVIFFILALRLLNIRQLRLTLAKKFRDNIFNTSSDAIIIIEMQSQQIVDCNTRAAQCFGFEIDVKTNRVLSDWHELKDILLKEAPLLQESNTTAQWQGDIHIALSGKTAFFALTRAIRFMYEGKTYVKISFLDITQQKEAAMEILRAKEAAEKALQVRTRFLSNMSHELRTPLNGIIGSASLVADEYPPLQENTFFNIIRTSSQHMLTLVNQVLDYSKLEAGQFQLVEKPFMLRQTLQELADSFKWDAQQKGIEVKLEVNDSVPDQLLGDPLRLLQVLMNLFSNAVKFSEAGMLELRVNNDSITGGRHFIRFEVLDNGIGIPADKRETIFEGFVQADAETTRKYGGTGLGLTISRELVKRMGGTLLVKNNEPGGAVFYFTIPFVYATGDTLATTGRENKFFDLSGKRILLVEDNPVNRLVAHKMLEKWHARIVEANDGRQGLEMFMQQPFDLLLIDLEMPEMDGNELITRVRQVNPDIPAIAFTAAAYDNIFEDLSSKGFSAFVPKPFVPYKLNHTMARLLHIS